MQNQDPGSRIQDAEQQLQKLATAQVRLDFGTVFLQPLILLLEMADQIQMDDNNKAMCWALRHPPGGEKPMPLKKIQLLVRKRNGKKPTVQAISLAASTYKDFLDSFCYICILSFGPWSTGNANFLSRHRPLHLFQPCPFPQPTPS